MLDAGCFQARPFAGLHWGGQHPTSNIEHPASNKMQSDNMNVQRASTGEPFKSWTDKQVMRMAGTPISRREAVQRTMLGAAGLVLGHHLSLRTLAGAPAPAAKAK